MVCTLSLIILGCGPKKCTLCGGTGKTSVSKQIQLPCEIISNKYENRGIFNPDYFAIVKVKNNGNQGGNFVITTSYIYKGIGKKDILDTVNIDAHSIITDTIHYDADKVADSFKTSVLAPIVVETKEQICPACGGKGMK